jgi:hypothetical protein
VALGASLAALACSSGGERGASDGWVEDFDLAGRTLAPTGRNEFFVLEPGYRLVLASEDAKLVITVLDETRRIGGTTTRVVEEREEEHGALAEISRNFFAIDPASGDVFYFGEEVDLYEDGALSGHEGAWRADEPGAKAGLIMPGSPRVGARYSQEIAPGKALDRAEVVALDAVVRTPAGTFERCLRTLETSGLDPKEHESKLYAPGVGLVQEEDLLLVEHGFAR